MEVTEETPGVPAYDGCIALGFGSYSKPYHIINKLISSKLITKPIVGIHFDTKKSSEIMLGDYNTAYAKARNIIWSSIDNKWSYSIADLSLGNYRSGPISLDLITNNPNFRAPNDAYDKIFAVIKAKATCKENRCEMLEDDYLVLPKIKLKVNDKTKWKLDYLLYTKELKRFKRVENCTTSNCRSNVYVSFDFLLNKGDNWGIGTNGLKQFYVVIDYESKRIGLAYQDSMSTTTILIIVLTIIIVIAIIIAVTLIVELKCKAQKR